MDKVTQMYRSSDLAEAEGALQFVSPDCDRDDWATIAMALKSAHGEAGFIVFDEWSQGSGKYDAADCKSTWRSINANGGITIATLFKHARDGGYKPRKESDYTPVKALVKPPVVVVTESPEEASARREMAQKYWAESKPDVPHEYADNKGFPDHGLRVHGKWLVVPAYNAGKQIQSAQRIGTIGKFNLKDTHISGCYYPIGGDTSTFYICEGWATGKSINAATGNAVAVAFGKGNLKRISVMMKDKLPGSRLIVAADTDHVDTAIEAALAVGGSYVVPDLTEGTDFNDLHQTQGLEAVTAQLNHEPEVPTPDYKLSLETIAKVGLAGDREKLIKALSKEQGIGLAAVRQDVNKMIVTEVVDSVTEDIEPWPEPVDGDELLQNIFKEMDGYVYFGRDDIAKQKILTLSLYVMYSHCFDAFDFAPYINIMSPTKRCGKNTVMNPMVEMSFRSELMANATTAVLFRLIESQRPTLFIDEADSFLKYNDDLRGIINSGWHRNGSVRRCVGDDNELKKFSTFCPKVIAGIGALPGTIQDRSIVIEIRRKPLTVKVNRFRTGQVEHLHVIARKCARWSLDNIDDLRLMVPTMPEELNDRAADVWEPLIAIADLIGGDLPVVIREAAIAISSSTPDAQDTGEMLIEDLFVIFEGRDFVLTTEILERLHSMDSRPWNEYSRGKPITAHKLAGLTGRFNVHPIRKQEDKTRLRGYSRKDLESVWLEYLGKKS